MATGTSVIVPGGQPGFTSRANKLLSALSAEDLAQVTSACETVSFASYHRLASTGDPVNTVYFPTAGYASLFISGPDGSRLQVALVGSEGILGWESLLGTSRVLLGIEVPESFQALSLNVKEFNARSSELACWRSSMLHYIAQLVELVARNGLCVRFHRLEARLARCLLELGDRHADRPIRLTQQSLSDMLGVRRSGVTNAATHLQLLGLIQYRRGSIRVTDRAGLESAACTCYHHDVL
ncbi:Crp/Fnr family transcriptional regulator [Wenzhouxiangella sp. AB-CW3]|uniref:Crp/Fnr family transcriptional regulator n=1 Tax=Wenzhouxiangella sp. AB-CW3 TaxID=2771012 RepID=UPI00168B3833|nr:Crp/Fnr family transcriptional regulator [Wenzhouxiangella sp. AB-CW3]QOC24074.1 Crp/Fnr family transcriptional regulator [Wenzhouxiangella sp. AB-CW3]